LNATTTTTNDNNNNNGARVCRRPLLKILQAECVFSFFGVRGEKKRTIKLQDAFWISFWALVGGFLLFFWCVPRATAL
jgi:hypothetical protein